MVGCVRAGIHAADGYPGHAEHGSYRQGPVIAGAGQDHRGWSQERSCVAASAWTHVMSRRSCRHHEIPGLYHQACDVPFTSVSCYMQPSPRERSSTTSPATLPQAPQHVIAIPATPSRAVGQYWCSEPLRTHQGNARGAAGGLAVISRTHCTLVVILAGGLLCHSEHWSQLLNSIRARSLPKSDCSRSSTPLPGMACISYDATVMAERMPGLILAWSPR